MPALLDPSVHRDADATVAHLVAMLDGEDTELDEFWADDRSSRGDGVEVLQAAPSATFPGPCFRKG